MNTADNHGTPFPLKRGISQSKNGLASELLMK